MSNLTILGFDARVTQQVDAVGVDLSDESAELLSRIPPSEDEFTPPVSQS